MTKIEEKYLELDDLSHIANFFLKFQFTFVFLKIKLKMSRTIKDYIVVGLKGMAMGAADVVPGVSGGTSTNT